MKEIRLLEQNVVLLSGRLGSDAVVRFTPKGLAVCDFRLAVSRRVKDDASGEWKDDVAWVPVTVFGEAAERLKDKLKKGSPVHVEGRLRSSEFTDKAGQKRSKLEVVARRIQALARAGEADAAPAPEPPAEDRADEGHDKTNSEEVPF